jgi:hypothetical protein
MDESEADKVVEAALDEEKKRKQADILIDIGRTASLFRTPAPDRDAYADITIDGHRETWRVRSKGFRGWLRHKYFEQTKSGCSSEPMQTAIETLVSFALFDKESEEREIHIRVAEHDDGIYIDIGDQAWRAIEVTAIGWRVVDDPPVRFRRTPSTRSLPLPVGGGSIEDLRKLVNVRTKEDFVLLVAYALAALRPNTVYPVLGVAGVQGSAKSTLIRLIQKLIDPRLPKTRSLPRDEDDLIVAAKGAHFLPFDNVSWLPDQMSDAICRLSTGGGAGKRQLYTDDDEVLFNGTRPVAFNGIEDIATRPDLVERTILLWLVRPKTRRKEREIDSAFDSAAPKILGALLNGLVSGLANVDFIDDADLPRMADFAVWAEACCRAYWPADTFMKAYKANLVAAVEVVLDASAIATAIRALMAKRTEWEGTATELLEGLTNVIGEKAAKEKDWPKRPNTLANKLRRVTPDLAKVGIVITSHREGHDRTRVFTIKNENRPPEGPGPDYRGKTSSASSASSAAAKINELERTVSGEKIARGDGDDRPQQVRAYDGRDADDLMDDENREIVRDKCLKTNKMDDADDPNDLLPTQSGNGAEQDRTCANCGEDDGKTSLHRGRHFPRDGVWLHRPCTPVYLREHNRKNGGNGAAHKEA